MSLTDRLLVSILAALAVWLIRVMITYFSQKSRLRAALLSDVLIHIAGMKEQQLAVAKLIEDHAVVGQKIPFPISYRMGEYQFYNSIQENLLKYLNKSELVRVVKFYQTVWELDVSINGLASTLGIWERDGIAMSENHVKHLKKRKERIDSFCVALSSKNIRKLEDLPEDYRSVKGPETVVEK